MFLFKPKKKEEPKEQGQSKANIDLEIITKMNQEFASSLDLNETSVSYTHLALPTKRIV